MRDFSIVVVGVDGSPGSARALERALGLGPGVRIVAVTAVEVGDPGAQRVGDASSEALARGEAALEEARERAAMAGAEIETMLGEGPAPDVLLDAASSLGATLLVVGSRGHGALGRLLLGSVSSAVVQQAPCDVLVVR